MDAEHNIYELTEDEKARPTEEIERDLARLDGFLKGRAESDRIKREKLLNKRHETLVHDSAKGGTYRRDGG